MPVKSKILVVEQKDSGFLNNFSGHTCTPKMSKFYDLRVLWFGWFLLKLPLNTISFKKQEKNFSFVNEVQAQIDQNSIQTLKLRSRTTNSWVRLSFSGCVLWKTWVVPILKSQLGFWRHSSIDFSWGMVRNFVPLVIQRPSAQIPL